MAAIPPAERRTCLLVPVAVGALVGSFRRNHHADEVARGIPPHVTVLFPFVRAASVDGATRSDLAAHFSTLAPFEAELAGVGCFEQHVWLAPGPRDRFVDLITATYDRFPECPPYEGEFSDPEPHLTIATIDEGDSVERVAELARIELGPSLPFRFAVTCVSLFEEQGDGKWQRADGFELG